MKKINWIVVTIVGVIALILLFGAGLTAGGWGHRGWGMMSGPGMMGGWGYSPFGWLGMTFMWLIPIGLVVLAIFGITWLVQNGKILTASSSPQNPCPNCGKSTHTEWQNCPYCGTALK